MKPIKIQQMLVCSALALTLPVIAIAESNPAGATPSFNPNSGSGTTNPVGATPPFNPDGGSGTTNPATAGGQSDIKDGNADATTGTSNPTGSSGKDPAPTQPIDNESIQEAVANCPLVETHDKVLEEALRVASITPNIDGIFNDASEAAKGCFAASSEVINLAMEIPSVSFSLTGIGDLVKENLERILMQKAEEVLDKGCAIADQALLGALDPLQEYLHEYSQRAHEFNGMIGNLEMGAEYEGKYGNLYESASGLIQEQIAGSKANISAGNDAAKKVNAATAAKYKSQLESKPFASASSRAAVAPQTYNSMSNSINNARSSSGTALDSSGWSKNSSNSSNSAPAPRTPAAAQPPVKNTTSTNPFTASGNSSSNPF